MDVATRLEALIAGVLEVVGEAEAEDVDVGAQVMYRYMMTMRIELLIP